MAPATARTAGAVHIPRAVHIARAALLAFPVALVAVAGCAMPGEAIPPHAHLHRLSLTGPSEEDFGLVEFVEEHGQLTIVVHAHDLEPGLHGFHLHANGSCANSLDAQDQTVIGGRAGGHFNPDNESHGYHAGDLGNLEADDDGDVDATLEADEFQAPLSLDPESPYYVIGLSVVIHAAEDDGETDPSGNSGARALCGIVEEEG